LFVDPSSIEDRQRKVRGSKKEADAQEHEAYGVLPHGSPEPTNDPQRETAVTPGRRILSEPPPIQDNKGGERKDGR
jgi:hypothetical protein